MSIKLLQPRARATRRVTLGLLAALAITLAAIAVPLAGTASAGGPSGGVVGDRAAAPQSPVEPAGGRGGIGGEVRASIGGGDGSQTFHPKLNIASGVN